MQSEESQLQVFQRKLAQLQFAMGKDLIELMNDDGVFEIILNPDQTVWIDTFRHGRVNTGIIMAPSKSVPLIKAVAALTDQIITDAVPMLSAEIPSSPLFTSARFQAFLPNVVEAPAFNIRKHSKVVMTLDDYVKQKTMTKEQKAILVEAIKDKKNIIAAGGTKSGKTTLLNAILKEISGTSDRIVIIEDTPELQCEARDHLSLRTMPDVTMDMLLLGTLRATPDRIVVGEVRGSEALALMDAWSTGHKGGCSTVHSNSAEDTLIRLENMTSRTAKNPQQFTISRAVDVIVYLKYAQGIRYIEDIIEVQDYDATTKRYITRSLLSEKGKPHIPQRKKKPDEKKGI